MSLKGLKPATFCLRDQDTTTAPVRHMWEIFKLSQSHASQIYWIPWICWIQWKFCSISEKLHWIFGKVRQFRLFWICHEILIAVLPRVWEISFSGARKTTCDTFNYQVMLHNYILVRTSEWHWPILLGSKLKTETINSFYLITQVKISQR